VSEDEVVRITSMDGLVSLKGDGSASFGRHLHFEATNPTKSVHDMVSEFHETYNAYVGDPDNVELPAGEHLNMRMSLIDEEHEELHYAVDNGDVIETIDALGDLVYVAYGMALALGVNLDDVITEIHRSNMSKLGADGKPIYREDMKVLKGPGYFPPDIAGVVGL
jgi:predicted HAD superfamily Cof-like phosphohydrolase